MINQITEFFSQFKNQTVETDELVTLHQEAIKDFASILRDEKLDKAYYENYLTIVGYAHRLDNLSQRLFYTFQEAVYAIDLAQQLKDSDALKLNSVVYMLVMETFIKEYCGIHMDEDEKKLALKTYMEVEQRRASENQKYHVYQ